MKRIITLFLTLALLFTMLPTALIGEAKAATFETCKAEVRITPFEEDSEFEMEEAYTAYIFDPEVFALFGSYEIEDIGGITELFEINYLEGYIFAKKFARKLYNFRYDEDLKQYVYEKGLGEVDDEVSLDDSICVVVYQTEEDLAFIVMENISTAGDFLFDDSDEDSTSDWITPRGKKIILSAFNSYVSVNTYVYNYSNETSYQEVYLNEDGNSVMFLSLNKYDDLYFGEFEAFLYGETGLVFDAIRNNEKIDFDYEDNVQVAIVSTCYDYPAYEKSYAAFEIYNENLQLVKQQYMDYVDGEWEIDSITTYEYDENGKILSYGYKINFDSDSTFERIVTFEYLDDGYALATTTECSFGVWTVEEIQKVKLNDDNDIVEYITLIENEDGELEPISRYSETYDINGNYVSSVYQEYVDGEFVTVNIDMNVYDVNGNLVLNYLTEFDLETREWFIQKSFTTNSKTLSRTDVYENIGDNEPISSRCNYFGYLLGGEENIGTYKNIEDIFAIPHKNESAENPTVIILTSDYNGSLVIPVNRFVVLDLNGHTISNNRTTSLTIQRNSVVDLVDSIGGGKVLGNTALAQGDTVLNVFDRVSLENLYVTGLIATVNIYCGSLTGKFIATKGATNPLTVYDGKFSAAAYENIKKYICPDSKTIDLLESNDCYIVAAEYEFFKYEMHKELDKLSGDVLDIIKDGHRILDNIDYNPELSLAENKAILRKQVNMIKMQLADAKSKLAKMEAEKFQKEVEEIREEGGSTFLLEICKLVAENTRNITASIANYWNFILNCVNNLFGLLF